MERIYFQEQKGGMISRKKWRQKEKSSLKEKTSRFKKAKT